MKNVSSVEGTSNQRKITSFQQKKYLFPTIKYFLNKIDLEVTSTLWNDGTSHKIQILRYFLAENSQVLPLNHPQDKQVYSIG